MRVVFLGTPEAAVRSLDRLLHDGHRIAAVVTQPDRPRGRSGAPEPPPVKARALEAGLPVAQPRKVRDGSLLATVREAEPDVLVVVAYGRILPSDVLEAAPLGAVNVHFSLLPLHRGAAPVQWALAHGEERTGVTTMRIAERLDAGDVYARKEVAIGPREHAPALTARLSRVGADLLAETLGALAGGTARAVPQDEARATHAPVLTREHGALRPSFTAREVEGRVRGFDPWPGIWAAREGRRLRIVEAEAIEGRTTSSAPGTVLGLEGGRILLACAGGSVLAVDRVQPEGRKPVAARDAWNGRQIAAGDLLAPPPAP